MDWYGILIITHIIGVALGVGGATFAEIFYLRAARDGQIDATEGDFLKTTYRVLRAGLVLLVFSGFGFLLWYRFTGQSALLYEPIFLAKLTVVFIILMNALLLQAHKVPLWLGSPLSLTSWYAALILGAWRGLDVSYISVMIAYIISVGAVAFALSTIRKLLTVRS